MILKKVKITNYRQLQNVELDMQDSLTVLAGSNNSGKTTLISVLKGMFCDKKLSFNYSDIPIQLSSDWLDKILPIFQAVMIKYDRESGVREIITNDTWVEATKKLPDLLMSDIENSGAKTKLKIHQLYHWMIRSETYQKLVADILEKTRITERV